MKSVSQLGHHHQKLTPVVPRHRQQLADFRQRFWAYYRELRAYRQQPTPAERTRLAAALDTLLATRTGYAALDDRVAKTQTKKAALLLVLPHRFISFVGPRRGEARQVLLPSRRGGPR